MGCTTCSLVGHVVAVVGDELIDVLVVVPFYVLGEKPHLRHILEGKVGVFVVLIAWLDDEVIPTFLEDFVQVV